MPMSPSQLGTIAADNADAAMRSVQSDDALLRSGAGHSSADDGASESGATRSDERAHDEHHRGDERDRAGEVHEVGDEARRA